MGRHSFSQHPFFRRTWRRRLVFGGVAVASAIALTVVPDQQAPTATAQTDSVNVLVRGQSNALLFADRGGAQVLEQGLEARLGKDVVLVYRWGDDASTIHSATAFMDWDTDGQQASLLRHVEQLPADVRDDPTLTLWLHNEYDQGNWELTTADWLREVRADADLVRDALGQGAATTPYLFVPIRYPWGQNWDAIGDGMAELDGDPDFHADISWAARDLVMDGDGRPDSSHMGDADAVDLGNALVDPAAALLSGSGGGGGDFPPVQLEAGSGPDGVVLGVTQDEYDGSARYTVAVDGTQVGGEFTASALRGSGGADTLTLRGNWGPGEHSVAVTFVNDAWGGVPGTDRNLYVESLAYNGATVEGATAELYSPGTAWLTIPAVTDPSEWTLVHADGFDGADLDPAAFEKVQGVSGHSRVNWVHDNVVVSDGVVDLVVETTRNEAGAFMTKNRIVQSYGKYEVRARIDEGKGVGLALLLWPESEHWPHDGEIDFAEMPRRDRVHFTNHWHDQWHRYESDSMPLDVTQWHTYGVEWTPESLTFLVDGQVRKVMTEHVPTGPMWLGVQTEYMGTCDNGDWIPCPDETTPDVVRAQIDDVRIHSRA